MHLLLSNLNNLILLNRNNPLQLTNTLLQILIPHLQILILILQLQPTLFLKLQLLLRICNLRNKLILQGEFGCGEGLFGFEIVELGDEFLVGFV